MTEKGYTELGFAKPDTDRKARTGFSETVFCQGKEESHLIEIFRELYEKNGEVLGTRASKEQADAIIREFPGARYNSLGRTIALQPKPAECIGKIVIVTAGTADAFVAEEAIECARFWGTHAETLFDVGVTGIHRLLDNAGIFQDANAIIAVAGMEGALASVVGGLVKVPVIAVPTSVGYGANLEGIATLLSMINSCANGITVVNIDNGYGAAYTATQINRLAEGKRI